jgi:hypothetical protein
VPELPPRAGEQYTFSHKLTEAEIGGWLARAFFGDEIFLGMRLLRREPEQMVYEAYQEEASTRVIKLFFEQAQQRQICGVKHVKAIVRMDMKRGWRDDQAVIPPNLSAPLNHHTRSAC